MTEDQPNNDNRSFDFNKLFEATRQLRGEKPGDAAPGTDAPQGRDDFESYASQSGREQKNRRWLSLGIAALFVATGGAIIFNHMDMPLAPDQIPTIHADTSPIKVRPTEPGGEDVPFQDKTVFDRLNPTPAPDAQPTALAQAAASKPAEEAPMAAAMAPPAPEAAPAPAAPADTSAPTPPASGMQESLLPAVKSDASAPIASSPTKNADAGADSATTPTAAKAPPAEAVTAPLPPPLPEQKTAAAEAAAEPTAPSPAPKAVKAPTKRAADKVADATPPQSIGSIITKIDKDETPASPPPAAAAAADDQKADAGPANGVRIQIASIPNEALAQSEAAKLSSQYADALDGISLTPNRVDLGSKGIFWRIQSPRLDRSRAAALCRALKDAGASCIIAH